MTVYALQAHAGVGQASADEGYVEQQVEAYDAGYVHGKGLWRHAETGYVGQRRWDRKGADLPGFAFEVRYEGPGARGRRDALWNILSADFQSDLADGKLVGYRLTRHTCNHDDPAAAEESEIETLEAP